MAWVRGRGRLVLFSFEIWLVKSTHAISSASRKGFLPLCMTLFVLLLVRPAQGSFLSRFDLSLGGEFNDNLFFAQSKTNDFIFSITPALSLLYDPVPQARTTFSAKIGSPLQIYARNSELNNIGDNVLFNTSYGYRFSPRLTSRLRGTVQRVSAARTTGSEDFDFKSQADLTTTGARVDNDFSTDANFQYTPNLSFSGGFGVSYTAFIDEGGGDADSSVKIRGVYKWREKHNLKAGYTLRVIASRSAENSVIHEFYFGDDFLSDYKIRLTPTLTLLASTGISLNTSKDGPTVVNNTNVTLTKVWQRASVTAGLRRGLTGSLGVAGVSLTTDFFSDVNISLTEHLTGRARFNFSLFETDDVDFNLFQSLVSVNYQITQWVSSTLKYTYRSRDVGDVNQNSVLLFFTFKFDIWPNVGLSRALTSSTLSPSPSRELFPPRFPDEIRPLP